MRLSLSPVGPSLIAGVARLRKELARSLELSAAGEFRVDPDLEPPDQSPLAWPDPSGSMGLSHEAVDLLGDGDARAVAAVAHQIAHRVGSGPSFVDLAEQMLEEAISEVIAQVCLGDFVRAFGGDLAPDPLARAAGEDVELARPVGSSVAVGRFVRVAAWAAGMDARSSSEEIEGAALRCAIRLKRSPGEKRFEELARRAAALGGGDDDVGAAVYLEGYLRGYMRNPRRSVTGFDALRCALAVAWGDEPKRPARRELEDDELERVEGVILSALPAPGAIDKALGKLSGVELDAALRTLDARVLLWSARARAAATR